MRFLEKLPSMDFFRSEKMCLVQLIVPAESAHRAFSYLGELGLLQFKDSNKDKSPFQRIFVNQVKRCAEMARKLRFFKEQISKAGPLVSIDPIMNMEQTVDLEELERKLGEHELELLEMNANSEKLQQSYNELFEFKLVLSKAGDTLISARNQNVSDERELDETVFANNNHKDGLSSLEEQMQPGTSSKTGLGFISGIICKTKVMAFERMLFRATRGNELFNRAPAEEPVRDPISGEMVEKTIFVVFFSGEQAKSKILKICEAFGANCYHVPEDSIRQRQVTREVSQRLSDLQDTLDAGIRHRNQVLSSIGSHLEKWTTLVRKEKAVYDTMNMLNFDVTKKCLVAEGWCPAFAKSQIQATLQRATVDSNSQVGIIFHLMDAQESPPTYFRTNRLTNAFQEIVDAYGVANYQEANPAVYTIITFPFLFAVMFGDWGHGICLLLGALVLVLLERRLSSRKLGSFLEMAYGGRYVILLMSIFSIYCGFLYNEFFSVPFSLFGKTAYGCRDDSCSDATTTGLIKYRDTYPFGVDPKWRGSRSELPFLNSLKMKMSIVLGVIQMNLGIIISYFNALFFGNSIDIRYEFIPQMVFLNSLFGYLAILIIIKWCTGSQADLYHVMIYMFLGPTDDLGENQLFSGQRPLQILLVLLAFVSVPMMLIPKPFILRKRSRERFEGRSYGLLHSAEMDTDAEPDSARQQQHHEDFNFSEVFVHQLIHSIEFVLGAVSNTASYLRLWALSLAHAELSIVFYEKVLLLAWGFGGHESIPIQLYRNMDQFNFASLYVVSRFLAAFSPIWSKASSLGFVVSYYIYLFGSKWSEKKVLIPSNESIVLNYPENVLALLQWMAECPWYSAL